MKTLGMLKDIKIFEGIVKSTLFRDSCSTTFLRVIARGIGLLIPFFIARWFGISDETDAFFFVYGIVLFVISIFSNTLESFVVPFISEIRAKDKNNVNQFVTAILFSSLIVISLIVFVALQGFKLVVPIMTNFSIQNQKFVFQLLIEISPLFIFVTLSSVLGGVLNSYNFFKIPALSPGFRSLLTLCIIFILRENLGIHSVILGYVLGELFRCVILYIVCIRKRILSINFPRKFSRDIIDFYKTVFQRTTGLLAVSFNPMIDKTMASWLGLGAISTLDYADKIYAIPVILLAEGFMIVVLSHWARIQYEGKGLQELQKHVVRTCKVIAIVSAIVFIIFFKTRYLIVSIIFGGKLIQPKDLLIIADVLGYYLVGFLPLMLVMILGRALIILKQGMFLMAAGFLNCTLNVMLNILLMDRMGLKGIALSTTLVQVIIFFIYFFYSTLNFSAKRMKGKIESNSKVRFPISKDRHLIRS